MNSIFGILLIVSIFSTWIALKRIIGAQACPSESDLKKYFSGRLYKTAEGDRIVSHIGSCSRCQKAVNSFNNTDS